MIAHVAAPLLFEPLLVATALIILGLFIAAIVHVERKLKDEEIDYSLGWRSPARWL